MLRDVQVGGASAKDLNEEPDTQSLHGAQQAAASCLGANAALQSVSSVQALDRQNNNNSDLRKFKMCSCKSSRCMKSLSSPTQKKYLLYLGVQNWLDQGVY